MEYQKWCERLNAASGEIDAVLKASDDEARPLTDEDRGTVATLEAEITDLQAKIDQHKADEAMRQRQAARQKELATTGPGRAAPPEQPMVPETLDTKPRISFPRYAGRLHAFRGPNAQENAYRSGKFCLAIMGRPDAMATQNARQFCSSNGIQLLDQEEDTNTAGGFLVPEEFGTAIIDLREEYGVFRREAEIEPMSSDTKTVPRVTGGITAYYVDENTEITASDMTWDQVRLVARKLAALTKYSSELSEDAIISMAEKLAKEFGRAFASQEDDAGFLGTGASTYGGISGLITQCTTATATTVTAATGNTTFATLDLADFESMVGKLPQYAEGPDAKWYISKPGWAASMLRLIDAAGGNTGAMIAGTSPKEFLGYPVVISQKMNSTLTDNTGNYGGAYLGNLKQAATLGDRRGITIKSSAERFIELDQLVIVGTERYDIKVHDVGSTSVAGSMIMLRFAAS